MRVNYRCLHKFVFTFGLKGLMAFNKFQKRKKRGEMFPAFQFISVTNQCNLRCQGCWVDTLGHHQCLEIEMIHQVIEQSKRKGSYFFGILGGEPLMYKQLFEIFEKHSDCYFQLFTNGTLLTNDVAQKLRKLANVTPLISFEGDEQVADVRRGSKNVFGRTLQAVEVATNNKLVTGVAISVCKSNIDMALSDEFVNMMHDKGVIYLWYYIYRPSGANPCYDLALSEEQILRLRHFLVDGRMKYPMVLIDSYWDADGRPFCPAAEGLSHHINPAGKIEPCPVIQFAKDSVHSGNLADVYEQSDFLRHFKSEINAQTNGCILMENPAWLSDFAETEHAENTSGRKNMPEQLKDSPKICSHGSCAILPEKSWAYRMGKKRAFFGLGAYG
jgi:MoaA/NifB/PqqE/SkfB family radical SAM enzyme